MVLYECAGCGKQFPERNEIRRHYEGRIVNGEAPEELCHPPIVQNAVMTRVAKAGVWRSREYIILNRIKNKKEL